MKPSKSGELPPDIAVSDVDEVSWSCAWIRWLWGLRIEVRS